MQTEKPTRAPQGENEPTAVSNPFAVVERKRIGLFSEATLLLRQERQRIRAEKRKLKELYNKNNKK